MGTRKTNSSPTKHTFEKIKEAVSVCPTFRALRRMASRSRTPSPAVPKPSPPVKTIEIHFKPDSQKLPKIPAADRKPRNGQPVAAGEIKPNPSPQVQPQFSSRNVGGVQHQSGNDKTGTHIEDRFTNYIENARKNITRTESYVGEHEQKLSSGGGKEKEKGLGGGKDGHFSDFIDRAKKKFKTTASIGGGRSISFKNQG